MTLIFSFCRSTKLDKIPFLAIARSLGDLWSFNSEKDLFVVSPVPDVHVYDLVDGREQFIVLASDGLWNMVSPSIAFCFFFVVVVSFCLNRS